MKGLDVSFEIDCAGKLFPQRGSLRCSPQPSCSSPGLLRWGEEDRAKTHCKVLVCHPVEGAEGCHQAEVVQQERQCGLEGKARINMTLDQADGLLSECGAEGTPPKRKGRLDCAATQL